MLSSGYIFLIIVATFKAAYTFNRQECTGQIVEHMCIVHAGSNESFASAKQKCASNKSIVALPLTVKQAVGIANHTANFSGNAVWVNLNDNKAANVFEMENGLDFANQRIDNWAPNEPRVSATDNCVAMIKETGKFAVRSCDEKLDYVCEIKMDCPQPFVSIGELCFHTPTVAKITMNDAMAQCHSLGGYVGFAANASENRQLREYSSGRFDSEPDGPYLGVHVVGLALKSNLDYSDIEFPNWLPGNPSGDGPCTNMYFGQSASVFFSNDIGCQHKLPFFCMCSEIVPTCELTSYNPTHGDIRYNVGRKTIKLNCPDGFALKGKDHVVCINGSEWAKQFGPICLAQRPRKVLRMKPSIDVNPAHLVPFEVTDEEFQLNCVLKCHEEMKCVFGVLDWNEKKCKLYDRGYETSDLIYSENCFLLVYEQ